MHRSADHAGRRAGAEASATQAAIDVARDLKVPVLARGGGTSQCGQTTGAALVIDNSKHFRRVLDLDLERRTVTVEPGIVLDHLNAQLKPHGLWYPVDVSTSAQATLGGMAGNNSCGSRSIAYGNMVHNVAGASAWLSDGELVDFGPVSHLGAGERHRAALQACVQHRNGSGELAQGAAARHQLQPRHLRQPERSPTPDSSVNLAHLQSAPRHAGCRSPDAQALRTAAPRCWAS
jgi:FAD/FMN-containing dehydrogenase